MSEYKIIGYLPEAFVNFLALLGWNPGTDKEIFSIEELTAAFDIEKVQKGAAVFNEEKLKWMNREHLRALPHEEIAPMVLERLPEDLRAAAYANLDIGQKVLDRVILERIHVLSEVTALADAGEFSFYFSAPHVAREKIVWKKGTAEKTLAHLDKIASILHTASFESPDTIKRALFPYADKEGRGRCSGPTGMRFRGATHRLTRSPFLMSSENKKQFAVFKPQETSCRRDLGAVLFLALAFFCLCAIHTPVL